MISLKLKSFAKYLNPFLCGSGCDCGEDSGRGWLQVRDWAGQCQSATVVVSSANSQQAGHDPPTVEGDGADMKGVLHTCPDSDARTAELWKVLQ